MRLVTLVAVVGGGLLNASDRVDFNREIRGILSNKCFRCHGPDEKERKGGTKATNGLRLDTATGARADLGGYAAVVPGNPSKSELIRRITARGGDRMPPPEAGKPLAPAEIALLRAWIAEGAEYAQHWSYKKPVLPGVPPVKRAQWPQNAIDRFVLRRIEAADLHPSPPEESAALVRRLSLDVTGLPPTPDEVDAFLAEGRNRPDAVERLLDRLLASPAYGEHWGRMWLDLARYADSAGYADDPPRTIWGYRDYVVRSFNANKPFDQFTIEQIAGDLLPEPTNEQLVATAFHRNTLTNNEGGTNDEEFRNVAIVDRVNTTLAVWMGTTIACAQCHSHKYDPISQEEYFQLFAFFNNTADADRRDESPLIRLYTAEQEIRKALLEKEIAALKLRLRTPTPELLAAQAKWEKTLNLNVDWNPRTPQQMKTSSGAAMKSLKDGSVLVARGAAKEVYDVHLPLTGKLGALRLETLPHESLPEKGSGHGGGNFVVTRVAAAVVPPKGVRNSGRIVRVTIPGRDKYLSLAEVQVFSGGVNVARRGRARQISTAYAGPAHLAIDGNTNGKYDEAKSTTHTDLSNDPWWEVDIGAETPVDRIAVWNRTDNNLQSRLTNFQISLLNTRRETVWEKMVKPAPNPNAEFALSGVRPVRFRAAFADFEQSGFGAAFSIDNPNPKKHGWAIGGQTTQAHWLTLIPQATVQVPQGSTLHVTIEQNSEHKHHTVGRFRLSTSADSRAVDLARTPANILAIARTEPERRSAEARQKLTLHYLGSIAPELQTERERLAKFEKERSAMKPGTSVPIMKALAKGQSRTTKVQMRGNFLITGKTVSEGTPTTFHPLPEDTPRDRLALARWLVSPENPLTARVIANRYWERVFGHGIVRTSEEFGAQGELPTHPELLDWLAIELQSNWDVKLFTRRLLASATYRQSSRVRPEDLERDPNYRWLARGPRFRLSAEMIRDQALFVGGLLSTKMFGPPVRPPQPRLGVSAAFGSGIDWQPSPGEDRFRRGLYTTWRRSNPYPSMATFDAPNREVCTIRRARTNTPLQALVTMNDPVYVEAAQGLGRRMAAFVGEVEKKVEHGFRWCLSRRPRPVERDRLVRLYRALVARYKENTGDATRMATEPIGALPKGADAAEYAAWTVVANVLLNLDETLMRR